MRSARLAPALLLLLPAACVRETARDLEATYPASDDEALAPAEPVPAVREVVMAPPAEDDEGEPAPLTAPAPAEAAPPPARRAAPEPAFFHLGAGYGALGQVDLARCRDQGLQRGYLRMHVTFHNSGRVARAAVEAPVAPPAEALTCIGEQLEAALVPEFGGREVTLSRSFFVN